MPAGSEGTPFGRYHLLRAIARGGMAEIFLAKQSGPGKFERQLVIKKILPNLAQDPAFVQMFLDEAALAAQLTHPNIAQVYDFGEEDGSYFIALELVRGPDMRNLIRAARKLKEPVPPELAVRMIADTLAALDFAHNAKDQRGQPLNLVHRDVSPQNVLVSYDGVVKLVDFGIAKAATGETETEAGVVKGKYAYFAPEQIRKLKLDGRTDMYAAALVLYELLTLKQGLEGDGMEALIAAMEGRITPLGDVLPDLDPALVDLVQRALSQDRDERQPNCREFKAELEGWLVQNGQPISSNDVGEYLRDVEGRFGSPLSALGAAGSLRAEAMAPSAASRTPASGPKSTSGSGPKGATGSGPRRAATAQESPQARIRATSRGNPLPAAGGGDDSTPPPADAPVVAPRRPPTSQQPALNPGRRGASGMRAPISIAEDDGEATSKSRPAPMKAQVSRPLRSEQDDGDSSSGAESTPPQGNARPAPAANRGRSGARPAVRTPDEEDEKPARKKSEAEGSNLSTFISVLFLVAVIAGIGVTWKLGLLTPENAEKLGKLASGETTPPPSTDPKRVEPPPDAPTPTAGAADSGSAPANDKPPETGKPSLIPAGALTVVDAGAPAPADVKPAEPPKPKGPPRAGKPGIDPEIAVLNVTCEPPSELFVDDESKGEVGATATPVQVPAGAHRIAFKNKEFNLAHAREATFEGGKATALSEKFAKGTAKFVAVPWGEVSIGKKKLGQTPFDPIKLWEGKYTAVLEHDGKKETRQFEVKPDAEVEIRVDFTK